MEDYRSKSYNNGGGMDVDSYYAYNDYRSYSASYASSSSTTSYAAAAAPPPPPPLPALPPPPGKSTTRSKSWSFVDPELQRKKRVASYKVYSVEGKVKGSFRKSFRWVKDKCSQVVYGWR